jgi:catechol 2,3-dioxygenase-like lactoylglutathione lyase family enzyme
VHLHVGDLERRLAFYRDVLGFELMTFLPGAAFVSAGGYHHHLAFNVWRGEGVPPAPAGRVGLRIGPSCSTPRPISSRCASGCEPPVSRWRRAKCRLPRPRSLGRRSGLHSQFAAQMDIGEHPFQALR